MMAKLERMDALEHRVRELKGISDVLWESFDCQVGIFEAKMNIHGSGSNKTPQATKQLVVIKETKKQLRDTIKTLDTKVKDSTTTFRSEVNKLVTIVKMIMMALGKSPLEGSASKQWASKNP